MIMQAKKKSASQASFKILAAENSKSEKKDFQNTASTCYRFTILASDNVLCWWKILAN